MLNYLAITQRNGQWAAVYSGPDPGEVYQHAVLILRGQDAYPDEEEIAISPAVEHQIDSLRVVPEEVAHDVYHVGRPLLIDD